MANRGVDRLGHDESPAAALNALFFVLAILSRMASRKGKVAQLAKFGIGLGVFVVLIALYNYARFGNPLESGYSMQMIRGIAYTALDVPGNRPGSLFSLGSMPGNLSVFFFGLPEVRAVGTSVFIVSPYLIYLWRVKWDLTSKLIAVDIAVVLLALMAFRSTGFEQMGYRFSLDFLPFVFWLLIRSRVPMTATFKTLIVGATIVDAFLVGYFLATGTERQILF